MGSFCSCFQAEHFEDHAHPIASVYSHCICLQCFMQQLIHMCSRLFQRRDMHAIPQSIEQASPTSSLEISTCEAFRSLPRPLPYDDPRYSRVPHDRLVSGRDKPSSHIPEESEPLRSNSDIELELPSAKDKQTKYNYNGKLKGSCSEFELKLSKEFTKEATYFGLSSEEEDVCPTCLEEYTPENPRIVLQCSHDFHLGCIYEWMERSEACPVCGKTMVFSESAS